MGQQDHLYHYRATITGVYDGDTCTAVVDLGFHTTTQLPIRFWGINTPELKGETREKGLVARDFLRSLILNQKVIIQTIKDETEKYGRYLGIVWAEVDGKEVNVNQLMVEKGYAVVFMTDR